MHVLYSSTTLTDKAMGYEVDPLDAYDEWRQDELTERFSNNKK